MLKLFKSAINKEPSTKNDARAGDTDDFFSKGAVKNEIHGTAAPTNEPPTKGRLDGRALRKEFRASEYGLVIRDLDKEREQMAKTQSSLSRNQPSQSPTDTTAEANNRAMTNSQEAPGTVDNVSMHSRPSSGQKIGQRPSLGKPLPKRPDNEGQGGLKVGDEEVTSHAIERQSGEHEDEIRLTGGMPGGHAGFPEDDKGHAPNSFDQATDGLLPNKAYSGENDHDDTSTGNESGEAQQAVMDDETQTRDLDGEGRNLGEGMESPGGLDGYQSNDDSGETAAGNEMAGHGEEEADFHDNRTDENDEYQTELNDYLEVDGMPADQFDALLENHEAHMEMSQGSLAPSQEGQNESDGEHDPYNEEYGQPGDSYSDIDESFLQQQEQDIGNGEDQPESHRDQSGGEFYDEVDDQITNPDEEDVDQLDGRSGDQGDISLDDIQAPVEENQEELDEVPRGDESPNGERFEQDGEEGESFVAEDAFQDDQGSYENPMDVNQGDAALEGEDDQENEEGMEEIDNLDADLEGDDGLEEYNPEDGNHDPELDDGVAAEEELTEELDSAAENGEFSDVGSELGRHQDVEETAAEDPLAVNGREWTEAHMEAFKICVRSKSNLFDFLARRGVLNRERVSEVVAESLKLCLKDTTALRGKTHATVFMEAGVTPLGPFMAFLALTVQSTMNSSKRENQPKAEDLEGGSQEREPKAKRVAAAAPPLADDDDDEVNDNEEGDNDDDGDDEDDEDDWDEFEAMDNLQAPPSQFEASKPGPVAPPSRENDSKSKRPEIATNIMVVLFLQAILESSRAAISGPAKAYLEWTFIPQPLEINSGPVNCKDENDGSLHEKRSQRTAAFNLKWEDVNPLEYVSIGTVPMYSKQRYVDSHDVKAQGAAHMISMICERLRSSKRALSEYDRTTFAITSCATSITFAYAVFTPEYIKHFKLEQGFPSTLNAEMDDLVINEEPELKMFESIPYDLSKWDEAHEAAELALGLVEFLQKNGPLLAPVGEEGDDVIDAPLSRGGSLKRGNSTTRSSSAFGASGKRFPIKIRPQQPEVPVPSEVAMKNDEEAEHLADEGQTMPTLEGEAEGEEIDGDGESRDMDDEMEGNGVDGEGQPIGAEGDYEDELEEGVGDEEEASGNLGAAEEDQQEEGDANDRQIGDEIQSDEEYTEGGGMEAEEGMTNSEETEERVSDEDGAEAGSTGEEITGEEMGEGNLTEDEMPTANERVDSDYEVEEVPEDGSNYDETDADLHEARDDLNSPYPDDGEEFNDAEDRASNYDEDQYTPNRSPALGDHPQMEAVDGDYVSGEEEDFREENGAEKDYASGEDIGDQDYLSGEEDNADRDYRFDGDNADQDYRSDEDNAEKDYRSDKDNAEHDDGCGEGVEDGYISENDTAEVGYISGEENVKDKDLIGEDEDANFPDDFSDAGTQADTDGQLDRLEGWREQGSIASYDEGDQAEGVNEEFLPENSLHDNLSQVDLSEAAYMNEQEADEISGDEHERSVEEGEATVNGSSNNFELGYDNDAAYDDETCEVDETGSIDGTGEELPDRAFNDVDPADFSDEEGDDHNQCNHPEDENQNGDQEQDDQEYQEDDVENETYYDDHPAKPEHLSVIPEEDDDDDQLSSTKQPHYEGNGPNMEESQHLSNLEGDQNQHHQPDDYKYNAEAFAKLTQEDMQGIEAVEHDQHQQESDQGHEEEEEKEVGEPNWGDPIPGWFFDPQRDEYFELGDDGLPIYPMDAETASVAQMEHPQQEDDGQQGEMMDTDEAQPMEEGVEHAQDAGLYADGYDGKGYKGEGYDGQGYNEPDYDGDGYGFVDEVEQEERRSQQLRYQQQPHGQEEMLNPTASTVTTTTTGAGPDGMGVPI